ncbi:hypothetical protein [Rhodoferax sp. WC2427]|uniref:hypothetical protein n=1 Tax=Rhodoferax sp. WC2427 TaxID=3234144 RepID=UPI0034674998
MKSIVLALGLVYSLGQAQASLVLFDDIHTAVAARISDGYQNFNRVNFAVQNPATGASAGFANAGVSPDSVAFNRHSSTAMLLGARWPPGSPPNPVANDFVFYSAYFTAVYLHGLNIHLTGYLDGAQAYLQTTITDTDAARMSDSHAKADALYASADGGSRAGIAVDTLRGIGELSEASISALPGVGMGSLTWSRPRAR